MPLQPLPNGRYRVLDSKGHGRWEPKKVSLEWIIAAHLETSDMNGDKCACDWSDPEVTYVEHLSRVLREAYPEVRF